MDDERWKAAVLQAIYGQFNTNFFNIFTINLSNDTLIKEKECSKSSTIGTHWNSATTNLGLRKILLTENEINVLPLNEIMKRISSNLWHANTTRKYNCFCLSRVKGLRQLFISAHSISRLGIKIHEKTDRLNSYENQGKQSFFPPIAWTNLDNLSIWRKQKWKRLFSVINAFNCGSLYLLFLHLLWSRIPRITLGLLSWLRHDTWSVSSPAFPLELMRENWNENKRRKEEFLRTETLATQATHRPPCRALAACR